MGIIGPQTAIDTAAVFDRWERELARLGKPARSIKKRVARLRGLAREHGWDRLASIDQADIKEALTKLADAGRSTKTIETVHSELITFFGWAASEGLVQVNWAEGIKRAKGYGGTGSARKGARALREDEVPRLIDAARWDEGRERPTHEAPRSWVYHADVLTGGRYGQMLRGIRWMDVDIEGGPTGSPKLIFDSDKAKNGRAWSIPLCPEAVDVFKTWGDRVGIWRGGGGGAQPSDYVFGFVIKDRVFNADLKRAGIPKRTGLGNRAASFHSLRKTYCTNLVLAGVAPAVAQRLMQHRTIEMTMRVYAEVREEHLATAIDKLPSVFPRMSTGSPDGALAGDPAPGYPGPVLPESPSIATTKRPAILAGPVARTGAVGRLALALTGAGTAIAGAGFEPATASAGAGNEAAAAGSRDAAIQALIHEEAESGRRRAALIRLLSGPLGALLIFGAAAAAAGFRATLIDAGGPRVVSDP